MNSYPRGWEVSIREPIDFAINWLTVNPYFVAVTKFIRASIFLYLLDPLDAFLVGLPWWFVIAALGLIVLVSVSLKFALIPVGFMFFLAAAGLWEISIFILAGTSVSVLIGRLAGDMEEGAGGLVVVVVCATMPERGKVSDNKGRY